MLRFEADLVLYIDNAGALDGDGYNGMMPSFNLNGELIACRIITPDGANKFARGVWHRLIVELVYGEMADQIRPDLSFKLNLI